MSGLANLEDNFAAYLARLRSLLDPGNLPPSLPLHDEATESIYGAFLHFTIDPDILEKTGDEVAAFNEQLKAIFGRKTCPMSGDGIIPIKERGKALSAAVDVLSRFHEKHPNNAVVEKWGFDIGKGVEMVYQIHGHEFPAMPTQTVGPKRRRLQSPTISESDNSICSESPCNNAELTKGGRPPIDLMNKAITKGTLDTGKKYWQCISSDCNYRAIGNAQQDRVYKHAAGCEALGRTHPDVRQDIVDFQSGASLALGALLQQGLLGSASRSYSEPPACCAACTPSPHSPASSAKKHSAEGKICKWAREGGEAKKREERRKMQQLADGLITQLVGLRGLEPDILDSPEWKELMQILNPNYDPTSADIQQQDRSEGSCLRPAGMTN